MNKEAQAAHAAYMSECSRNYTLEQKIIQLTELVQKLQDTIVSQQKSFAAALELAQVALAQARAESLQKLEVPHV